MIDQIENVDCGRSPAVDFDLTEINVKFSLVLLFVFSIFLVTNDTTLKIASMNASSIVEILMVIVFCMDCLARGRFALRRYPLQGLLFLLLLWASISLMISKVDFYKLIPDEAYGYVWASGLNSPHWRGFAFLLRLFLSIFAIDFIVSSIDTKDKYLRVTRYFLFAYALLSVYIMAQIVLYGLLGVKIGYILPPRFEGYFPVGGYVGESGTLAGLLASGYFVLFATLKERPDRRLFLSVLFAISTVGLVFTFSAAWIISVMLTFLIIVRKNISRKAFLFGSILLVMAFSFSQVLREVVLMRAFSEVLSSGVRTYSWLAGLEIFKDYIVTGVGIGQSVFFTPGYIESDVLNILMLPLSPELYLCGRFPPMNTYIQWMAETGAVGLILLLCFIYCAYKQGRGLWSSPLQGLVRYGYGGELLVVAIAMNAGPDNLYVGYINFLLAMYIAGVRLTKASSEEHG